MGGNCAKRITLKSFSNNRPKRCAPQHHARAIRPLASVLTAVRREKGWKAPGGGNPRSPVRLRGWAAAAHSGPKGLAYMHL
jgi:hypothetical protein